MTTTIDQAALVGALEQAQRTLERAEATLEQARGGAARSETQLGSVGDAARGAPGRGREVSASLQLLYETLERAKLSALNAGLEAARLGDPAGKIVLELSGDLRELVAGALEALEAHATLLGENEREWERWVEGVSQARETVAGLAVQLGTLGQQRQELLGALSGVERAVAPLLGADPKRARLLLELAEKSKALAESVTALGGEAGARDEQLRQALEPLLQALGKGSGQGS